MKKRTDTVAELIEEATPLDGELSIVEAVDGQPPTLRNVVLMGPESRFRGGGVKRRYTEEVMESLVDKFKDVRIYADHADPGNLDRARKTKELIGFVSNPRRGPDKKIRGDLTLMEGLEETNRALWFAKHKPALMGFSPHLREGRKTWKRGGVETIVGIGSVASADIVTEGATTHGLFESTEQEGKDMEFDTLTLADLEKNCPDLLESIRSESSDKTTIAALQAKVATLETAATARDKAAHKDLVESLVADLPATVAESVRALPETMGDDALRSHVGVITEGMGKKKAPASSEKQSKNDENDGARGVADSAEIFESCGLGSEQQ